MRPLDTMKIANVLERHTYMANEVIFQQDDLGNHAFIIESGRVEISCTGNGKSVVINTLARNALFGEMALIDDAPRMATAVAVEPTVCAVIPAGKFRAKMAKADAFIETLLRFSVNNLRMVTEELVKKSMQVPEPLDIGDRRPASPGSPESPKKHTLKVE